MSSISGGSGTGSEYREVVIYEPNPASARTLDMLGKLSDELGVRRRQERPEGA